MNAENHDKFQEPDKESSRLEDQARAEKIFIDFISHAEGGTSPDMDALCRLHPDLEQVLREMYAHWELAAGILQKVTENTPLDKQLMDTFGPEVDPGISLDPESSTADADSGMARVLSRLTTDRMQEPRYRMKAPIARGGMGAIYRVWDRDLRRNLAMKVILGKHSGKLRPGGSPAEQSRLKRFLEEAQITAQLDHPGIVPVHELGLDSRGRVYFTMRLVRGKTLKKVFEDVAAHREGWTETRALNVILRACEAMAFAHTKGVIHRDLKPANIMVGRFGETYVMDWGLARVLEGPDLHDSRSGPDNEAKPMESAVRISPVSRDEKVVGTPVYMAPEQARGAMDEMGARSDVYCMGAVLYHLLAGHMPYVPHDSDSSVSDILAQVMSGPPTPLEALHPRLPTELVAICEKAMAREPAQRYADMNEMAEDLRAYLENRVVRAHRTGALAEFKKWVIRNKGMAGSIAAAILIACLGLGSMSWLQARHAREVSEQNVKLGQALEETDLARHAAVEAKKKAEEAHDQAQLEAATTRTTLEYLVEIFSATDPEKAQGETVTAKDVLDYGANTVIEIPGLEDEIRASLSAAIGNSYHRLGEPDEAVRLMERSAEMHERIYGADHRNTLSTRATLGMILKSLGDMTRAEEVYRQVLDAQTRHLGPQDEDTLTTQECLASLYVHQGRFEEAEGLYLEVMKILDEVPGEKPEIYCLLVNNLAKLRMNQGRYAEATDLLEKVLEEERRETKKYSPELLGALNNLGSLHSRQGQYDQAVPYLEEVLALAREMLGDAHPDTIIILSNLAVACRGKGDHEQAEALYLEALAACTDDYWIDHPILLKLKDNLGLLYTTKGEYAKAEVLHGEVLEARRRVLPEVHPDLAVSLNNLALCLKRQGKLDEAIEGYKEAIDIACQSLGEGHGNTLLFMENLAAIHLEKGDHARMAPLLEEILRAGIPAQGGDHGRIFTAAASLARVYITLNRPEEARALVREQLDRMSKDHPAFEQRKKKLERILSEIEE